MLLTEMPAHPDAPKPKRVIAFDQAIRARMEELGLDEAGLVRRYVDYQRSQGDLKAKPENRRTSLINILNGNREPNLKTVFGLLQSQVLDGELLIQWKGQDDPKTIVERASLPQIIQQRIREIGLGSDDSSAMYELTRRYCEFKSGDKAINPANHISVTREIIRPEPNSRLQTLAILVEVLNGQLLLSWRKKVRQAFEFSGNTSVLKKEFPTNRPVILEYQEMSEPQSLKISQSK